MKCFHDNLICLHYPLSLSVSFSTYLSTWFALFGLSSPPRVPYLHSFNNTDGCQLKLKVVYTNYNSISWSSAFYVSVSFRKHLPPPLSDPYLLASRDISKLIHKLFFIAFAIFAHSLTHLLNRSSTFKMNIYSDCCWKMCCLRARQTAFWELCVYIITAWV